MVVGGVCFCLWFGAYVWVSWVWGLWFCFTCLVDDTGWVAVAVAGCVLVVDCFCGLLLFGLCSLVWGFLRSLTVGLYNIVFCVSGLVVGAVWCALWVVGFVLSGGFACVCGWTLCFAGL